MIIRQSTARTILVGPVLDSTGAAKTDEVVGSIKITKNGTVGSANGSATLTHDHAGKYKLALTATDTDTVGVLEISLNSGTNDMPIARLCVVEEAVYDAMFAASAAGYQVPIWASASSTVNLSATTVKTLTDAVALPATATIAITGNITGSLSGSVGSVTGNVGGNVTGSVGSVTSGVTVTTNNDKTGYALTQTFPTNFSAMAISVGGAVTAGTVSDKTGYSLTQSFPSNFASMSITAGGVVKADLDTIKTQSVTCSGGVTIPAATLASTTNISAGTIATVTSVTAIASGGITRASFAADTGLQSARSSTAQAGAAGTITLDASASATTDFYKHMRITLTGGTGAGQSRVCTAYNGTTKVATVTPNWTTAPDVTSTFSVTDDVSSNITAISGAAVSTSTAQLGVNVVNWGGTAVASATVRANAIQFAGQTITAAAGVTIPSSIASPTNITAATGITLAAVTHTGAVIPTVTTLTNLPAITTDWLTGTGVAASAVTKIQSGLSTYAGGDTSGTTTLLMRLSDTRAGYLDNLSAGAVPTAAAIADAVWDEAQSGHTTTGTFGYYVDSQVSAAGGGSLTAADVWGYATRVLTAGTNIGTVNANLTQVCSADLAGNGAAMAAAFDVFFDVVTPTLTTASVNQTGNCYPIVSSGTHGNAALKTLVDDLPTNAELSTALGTADDATLAAIAALSIPTASANASAVRTELTTELGRIDAAVSTRLATAGYTAPPSASTISTQVGTDLSTAHGAGSWATATGFATVNPDNAGIAAIQAKTDNLPADPADASDIASAFSTVNTSLATIAGYLDTEVAAIKARTDLIPDSPAAVGSAMTLSDGAITAAKIATDAITALKLASDACSKIADIMLRRTMANVEASSNGDTLDVSSLYGAIQQSQESSISGSTQTIKKTDGSTTLGTKTISTSAGADPIRGIS